VAGVLTLPADNGPAGRLVVTRLLASMFELLADSEVEQEVERAEGCADSLTAKRGWARVKVINRIGLTVYS